VLECAPAFLEFGGGAFAAKSSSRHRFSRQSRTHIAVVPAGLLALATRAVNSGTTTATRGRTDMPQPGKRDTRLVPS
jgi:hypothetical protein